MDKKIKLDDDTVLNYWKEYFKILLPLSSEDYLYREDIRKSLKGKDLKGNVAFICNLPIYKYTLIEALKRYVGTDSKMPTYSLITGYSLCEVWVKDLEIGDIRSLTDTYRPDILLIVIESTSNRVSIKDYFSIISQVITERTLRGKSTWLFYMGSKEEFNIEVPAGVYNVIPLIVKSKKVFKGGKDNDSAVNEYIC